MNGYELSRQWWGLAFESHEVKPIHSALYFLIIEHWNKLGQKQEFGFPSMIAIEGLSVSYNTYKKAFEDLTEWGFIKIVKKSVNQHQSNIIALSNIDKATDKALDKATANHLTKHLTKHLRHNRTKELKNQRTKEHSANADVRPTFEEFWDAYDHKVDKRKAKSSWTKVAQKDREKIMDHLDFYVPATNKDGTYPTRRNPTTYLNNQTWNNEVPKADKHKKNDKKRIAEDFRQFVIERHGTH